MKSPEACLRYAHAGGPLRQPAWTRTPGSGPGSRQARPPSSRAALLALLTVFGLAGCNLGSGGKNAQGDPGAELDNPDGSGTFFFDSNSGGNASRLKIAEVFWGRLVDVFALDPATGDAEALPRFRDFVINENIASNGVDYLLETNPATQGTRLIILREKDDPQFKSLIDATQANLPVVVPKNDDGTSSEPFSIVARNSCLVIRTNDLLDDDQQAIDDLLLNVQVRTSYPPQLPYEARVLFDRNHGGLAGGKFHSTRVLIDLTISELEAADLGSLVSPNLLGLPASLETTGQPNVGIRIPTRRDFTIGQFTLLTTLGGREMDTTSNGPFDPNSSTLDVVRAVRSGNSGNALESNNGFLFDDDPPQVVGGWSIRVDSALNDVAGSPGFDFLLDLTFQTACQAAPIVGDVFELSTGLFLEVTEDAAPPDGSGTVLGVRARLLTSSPVTNIALLLGGGLHRTPFDDTEPVDPACWVAFVPGVSAYPPADVAPNSQIVVRFSEPMDPGTVTAFDTLEVFRNDGSLEPAIDTVVGMLTPSVDLRDFTFTPSFPFAHSGDGRAYQLVMSSLSNLAFVGIEDLAGNRLVQALPPVDFSIDPTASASEAGSVVLRFEDVDEYQVGGANGFRDIRGGIGVFDSDRGIIQPRPVTRASYAADTQNPNTLPANYLPILGGVQTPLNPLGSKLQTVWRYSDLGWTLVDETKQDIDIEGLNWAPANALLIGDAFDLFEIRLSHSSRNPDMTFMLLMGVPIFQFPNSGLLDQPNLFDANILGGPEEQVVVHNRGLGYVVDPTDLFSSPVTGTTMAPFPLNQAGGPLTTFTWRDSTNLLVGGLESGGVPTGPDLAIYSYPNPIPYRYGAGQVPTIGLPLLMEFRAFPDSNGLGLNSLFTAFATPLPPINPGAPNFRAFSSGGRDQFGNPITRDPDLETFPRGGFNPNSTPPGLPTTSADNVFYVGQMDTIIRLSRVHTIWFDPEINSPDYLVPIVEPPQDEQPAGTGIVLEFRGASNFVNTNGDESDSLMLDPYGDPNASGGSITYFLPGGVWSADIDEIDTAAFFQVRMTFLNNIASNRVAELSTLAIPYGSF